MGFPLSREKLRQLDRLRNSNAGSVTVAIHCGRYSRRDSYRSSDFVVLAPLKLIEQGGRIIGSFEESHLRSDDVTAQVRRVAQIDQVEVVCQSCRDIR